MAGSRSPYDVLGVPPWASAEEIQRAYRALARRLHPDHLPPGAPGPEVARAAERMRGVNAAWQELRDPARRAAARTRWNGPSVAPAPGARPWDGPFGRASAPSRMPRAEVRRLGADDPSPPMRWRGLLGLLGVAVVGLVFVVTAYLGATDDGGAANPSGPYVGAPCVRVDPGPVTRVVECSGPNDGRVVAHVATASDCPSGTRPRRLDAADPGINCLQPAPLGGAVTDSAG